MDTSAESLLDFKTVKSRVRIVVKEIGGARRLDQDRESLCAILSGFALVLYKGH